MGNNGPVPVKQQLQRARSRAEVHVGKVAVTGRYHLLPRKLEDDFELSSQVLGTGLNGSVLLARSKETGNEVAVKPYTSVGINKDEQRVLRNEVEIFLSLDHPHVARLKAVYEEQDKLLLVMEVCKGGEILEAVTACNFSEARAAEVVEQMLLSVNYLHSKQIVHRDLKLDNFLFESEDRDHVKLIDFGMSRYWTNNKKMKLACGTVGYIAPECLRGSYTIECDLWSMGVIAYILLSGKMPFEGSEEQQITKTKSGDYTIETTEWGGVSKEGKSFVTNLMEMDVEKRLSSEAALQHPWITSRGSRSNNTQEIDAGIVKSLKDFAEISQFRRTCLQLMTYSLSLEERKNVRDAFLQIDHEQTGRIKLTELSRVLGDHVSDLEARTIFHSLDSNSDAHINYTDFLAAMLTSRIVQNEGHMRAAFNRFDRDGTGVISLENLREVLGDTHQGLEIEELFKEIDLAKDGVISYDEFMAYIQGDIANEAHQEAICKVIDAEIQKSPIVDPFRKSVHSMSPSARHQGHSFSLSERGSLDSPTLSPLKPASACIAKEAPIQEERETLMEESKGSLDEKAPLNGQPGAGGKEASTTNASCACNLL